MTDSVDLKHTKIAINLHIGVNLGVGNTIWRRIFKINKNSP